MPQPRLIARTCFTGPLCSNRCRRPCGRSTLLGNGDEKHLSTNAHLTPTQKYDSSRWLTLSYDAPTLRCCSATCLDELYWWSLQRSPAVSWYYRSKPMPEGDPQQLPHVSIGTRLHEAAGRVKVAPGPVSWSLCGLYMGIGSYFYPMTLINCLDETLGQILRGFI